MWAWAVAYDVARLRPLAPPQAERHLTSPSGEDRGEGSPPNIGCRHFAGSRRPSCDASTFPEKDDISGKRTSSRNRSFNGSSIAGRSGPPVDTIQLHTITPHEQRHYPRRPVMLPTQRPAPSDCTVPIPLRSSLAAAPHDHAPVCQVGFTAAPPSRPPVGSCYATAYPRSPPSSSAVPRCTTLG